MRYAGIVKKAFALRFMFRVVRTIVQVATTLRPGLMTEEKNLH